MLDYNGTPNVTSDDRHHLRTGITNQDGTSYSPDEYYALAEDYEGYIWVATQLGPFVITDPDNFASNDFTYEQVKVNRNDGSGLADYLLSGIAINAIAIDGANRKWFATQSNGVYLMSADWHTSRSITLPCSPTRCSISPSTDRTDKCSLQQLMACAAT